MAHFSESSGSKISPGIAILLGIISSCVLIVGVVIIYKYQRRLMYAIRFRRLQEVPMVSKVLSCLFSVVSSQWRR